MKNTNFLGLSHAQCGSNNWHIWTQKTTKEVQLNGVRILLRFCSRILYLLWTEGHQIFVHYIRNVFLLIIVCNERIYDGLQLTLNTIFFNNFCSPFNYTSIGVFCVQIGNLFEQNWGREDSSKFVFGIDFASKNFEISLFSEISNTQCAGQRIDQLGRKRYQKKHFFIGLRIFLRFYPKKNILTWTAGRQIFVH